MGAKYRFLWLILLIWGLVGCAAASSSSVKPTRIGLLAPFEGRYRDLGYEALYSARLALADYDNSDIELLPVDDGGLISSAAERAQGLVLDPEIGVVIVLGYAATDPIVQASFGDVPVIVVGDWGTELQSDTVYIMSSQAVQDLWTIPERTSITEAAGLEAPFTGGDVLSLPGFAELREDLTGITLVSSATLPDEAYQQRILESDQFASAPGLLSTVTYDAVSMAARVMAESDNRADVTQNLSLMEYEGINGTIIFNEGYWANAPENYYIFDISGDLIESQ